MKNTLLNIVACVTLLFATLTSDAREAMNDPKKTPSTKSDRNSSKTEAGDCVAATARFDLDINNVRATLLTGGDAWWNFSEPKYEVPKGDGSGPALNAIFAGSIWITGLDFGGNLKCAALTYRQRGNDFWPGPLTNGVVDKATCLKYDRHFNVYGADISRAQTAFLQKGAQTTLADIPKGVQAWPAKGNPYLANDVTLIGSTFNITDNLAPFKDVDADGIYDPVKGDYPYIPCRNGEAKAYGDQMIFWTFNDAGNIHTESNGQAIGVQVNALGFAFQSTDDINNMTFYKYEVVNKSSNRLFQTYMSQWVDPDLGCFNNDKVGCDTTRSLGICYNGTTPDPDCTPENGYGAQLPIVGMDFFEGPLDDSGQQLGLTSFVYFTNGAPFAQTDPSTAAGFRNYQTGFWNDGTPFTTGGSGYNSGGAPTKFLFPGNPSDNSSWSECQSAVADILPPGDRRWVQSSGPFTLNPGVSQYITIGVVFVRPNGNGKGVGLCPDFNQSIIPADDQAQNLFNTCFKLLDGPDAPTLSIRELNNEVIINLINLPSSNNVGEKYEQADGATTQSVKLQLGGQGDSTYNFEGYRVYQVTRPDVSATDLNDPSKALPVAQVDIKNGVARIINFIKDANLGLYVPTLQVDGADGGVVNSFRVTQDLFATGTNKQLINHKTYYYTAISYAYNNFKQYDQNAPLAGGQLLPYLQGRNNFRVYSAIPQAIDPRNTGTVLNSVWGDGVEVSRIEGSGNGGNNLQLTEQAIIDILNSGAYAMKDTLTYKRGFDPIGFKVTDPVALKEADFELHFLDTTGGQTNVDKPIGSNTHWFLRDITNDDTIWADRTLDRPYEQQVALNKGGERTDYGFSITLGTPVPLYTIAGNYLATNGRPNRNVYNPLESTIEYENPTQRWLEFVRDEGQNEVTNWIRSGTNALAPTAREGSAANPLAGVYDDNWYYTTGNGTGSPPAYPDYNFTDSTGTFSKILNGTWAPYCLAANYASRTPATGAPAYVYGPGFKWRSYYGAPVTPPHNTLDRLASVDIVITPDKSKWTRCIVLETGENEIITEGNEIFPRTSPSVLQNKGAYKGQIRMSYSIDKDANGNLRRIDPGAGEFGDTGRSWFPGYAINVETGQRLNMAFGESSDIPDQNGRDMLWNPSNSLTSPLGQTYFAGKHFIYVMETPYDEGTADQALLLGNYDKLISNTLNLPKDMYPFYQRIMWTAIPYVAPGYSMQRDGNGNLCVPPAEIKIKLRVEKPYSQFATGATTAVDSAMPRYQFSTRGRGATESNTDVAKSALDMIRVVPNPYLAYSQYETGANTSTVKVTNLPNNCKVTIFSLDGTLIRTLTRSIGIDQATNKKIEITEGTPVNTVNVESTIDWDLKNDKGIPIASGIYLFHVEAPGLGERTLKWFGAVRPADTSNY